MSMRHATVRHRRRQPVRLLHRMSLFAAAAAALLVAASVVAIVAEPWSGAHPSAIAAALLGIRLIGGPLPPIIDVVAVAAVVVVMWHRPTRKRIVIASIALLIGVAVALGGLSYVTVQNTFGVALDASTWVWVTASFAATAVVIAVSWTGPAWRAPIGLVAAITVVGAAVVGVNADFGLDNTAADLAGITTGTILTLPANAPVHTSRATPKATASSAPVVDYDDPARLWQQWSPPADMPHTGTTGQVVIPATVSGFHSRPAGLYLPPAALVADPPPLPLVILMMGQPGNPDPSYVASVLDAFAATHHGLAPIVVVADQLGDPSIDPLCLDTARYGRAETFLTQDVVDWAKTHLHITADHSFWTIAGYSNGGECALSLGVTHPELWSNVLDISGESYPGSDQPLWTLRNVFDGNRAAYAAVAPLPIMARTHYTGMTGIFTVGSDDAIYRPQAQQVAAAARAAGWATSYFEIPHGGHVLRALMGGLQDGFTVLFPKLGLAP